MTTCYSVKLNTFGQIDYVIKFYLSISQCGHSKEKNVQWPGQVYLSNGQGRSYRARVRRLHGSNLGKVWTIRKISHLFSCWVLLKRWNLLFLLGGNSLMFFSTQNMNICLLRLIFPFNWDNTHTHMWNSFLRELTVIGHCFILRQQCYRLKPLCLFLTCPGPFTATCCLYLPKKDDDNTYCLDSCHRKFDYHNWFPQNSRGLLERMH